MKYFFVVMLAGLLTGVAYAQHNHVQIAQQNMPAVVAVNVLKKDGSTFTGTGFVITEDGFILTARHVLNDALYTNITFPSGTTSGEAVPVAQANLADVALLKIEARHLPVVTLGDDSFVRPGQTITVIGNPRRLQNTVTSGLISQVRLQKDGTLWHQISAPISPSSSGSPVFNEQGQVISMAFATFAGEENQNLNFALPVSEIKKLLVQQGVVLTTHPEAGFKYSVWHHLQKSWQITKRLWRRLAAALLANPSPNR